MPYANLVLFSAVCVLAASACSSTVKYDAAGNAGETQSGATRTGSGGSAIGSNQASGGSAHDDSNGGATPSRSATGSLAKTDDIQSIDSSGGTNGMASSLVSRSGASATSVVYSGGSVGTGGTSNLGSTATSNALVNNGGNSAVISSSGSSGGQANSGGATMGAGGTFAPGGSSATGGKSTGTTANGGTTSNNGTGATGGTTAANCKQSQVFGSKRQILPSTGSSSEMTISVAADGLSGIVAVRPSASSNYDLQRYTRASSTAQFGNPVDILGAANVNTSDNEYYGRLNRDGLKLYFVRGSSNSSAIYLSTRGERVADLGPPVKLDTSINEAGGRGAWAPFVPGDDSYLYYIADSNSKAMAHRAEITSSGHGTPLEFAVINSIGNVNTVVVTDDQLIMYVSAKGTNGYEQIWKSTRTTASDYWSTPLELTELQESMNIYVADVSPDGCSIYYAKASGDIYHLWQADKPR